MQLRIVLEVEFDDHEELVKAVEKGTREALVITRREKVFANPTLITNESFNYRSAGTSYKSRVVHKYERDGRSLSFFRTKQEDDG